MAAGLVSILACGFLNADQPRTPAAGDYASPRRPAPPRATYADLHNSCLFPLYISRASADSILTERMSEHILPMLNGAGMVVLSLATPRFDMMRPDTFTVRGVVSFLRRFRTSMQRAFPECAIVADQGEVRSAIAEGRLVLTLALEGLNFDHITPATIDSLQEAGVQMIGIAHTFHNRLIVSPDIHSVPEVSFTVEAGTFTDVASRECDPSFVDDFSMLSPLGETIVKYLFAKGILLDVSHLGRRAFWQVVELNDQARPLIASHANARALRDSPRNLDDDQLRAIARSGGIVGICPHTPLLVGFGRRATVRDVIDHLDHCMKVMGPEHVAIGTDLCGLTDLPSGFDEIVDMAGLAEGLSRLGWSPDAVNRVMWRNVIELLTSPTASRP